MANPNGGRRKADAILRTTRWSLVRRATAGGKAMDEWASSCWYPLYVWARRNGCSPEDAADAVQEFLGKLCGAGLLGQADPSRGRFRSWLLVSFGNHLSSRHAKETRLKRGGGVPHLSIDLHELEILYRQDTSALENHEQAYTRAWALSLMDEALSRLEAYFEASGRMEWFATLLPVLEGPLPEMTYREAASRLGMNEAACRQAALRFRQRYRSLLLEVASERLGITCEARLAEELRELLGNT